MHQALNSFHMSSFKFYIPNSPSSSCHQHCHLDVSHPANPQISYTILSSIEPTNLTTQSSAPWASPIPFNVSHPMILVMYPSPNSNGPLSIPTWLQPNLVESQAPWAFLVSYQAFARLNTHIKYTSKYNLNKPSHLGYDCANKHFKLMLWIFNDQV